MHQGAYHRRRGPCECEQPEHTQPRVPRDQKTERHNHQRDQTDNLCSAERGASRWIDDLDVYGVLCGCVHVVNLSTTRALGEVSASQFAPPRRRNTIVSLIRRPLMCGSREIFRHCNSHQSDGQGTRRVRRELDWRPLIIPPDPQWVDRTIAQHACHNLRSCVAVNVR